MARQRWAGIGLVARPNEPKWVATGTALGALAERWRDCRGKASRRESRLNALAGKTSGAKTESR